MGNQPMDKKPLIIKVLFLGWYVGGVGWLSRTYAPCMKDLHRSESTELAAPKFGGEK